jgi:toxin ParE1/3/4
MPLSLRRWPQARADLKEIWLSIAENNLRAADGVLDRIDSALSMLTEQPEAGRSRDELRAGLRYSPVGSYLVFYSVGQGVIDVRRVLHGARDIDVDLFDG